MITFKDIMVAVNTLLGTTGIEINSRDVEEGFTRPSFFVQLDNSEFSGDKNHSQKSTTVSIYYFPTDRYEYAVEVLEVQEQLANLFDLKLEVGNRFLNIIDADSLVSEGVLSFRFNLDFQTARGRTKFEKHPNELMEILHYKKE